MKKEERRLKYRRLARKIHAWRIRNINDRPFMMILSVVVGLCSGFAAVVMKYSTMVIRTFLQQSFDQFHHVFYFIFPVIGISLTVIFSRFFIHRPIRPGIPNVLYAISKTRGYIRPHNTFSSIVGSALTVGFGGSAGLEGPTVTTGSAIGSWIGRFLHLNYRQVILLLGCACAGTMASIFKAPVAAIVFVLEVFMFELNLTYIVPLLMASTSAVLTSYLFTGQDVLYPFEIKVGFVFNNLFFYILLGIFTGIVSVTFTHVFLRLDEFTGKFKLTRKKILIGGLALGAILFFFPALYGEGYEVINACLKGNVDYVFDGTIYQEATNSFLLLIFFLTGLIIMKMIATALTVQIGGVGGIFAPTLFIGANSGILFALVINYLNINTLSNENFALVGMSGLIAGVLHAPLTGIFLIAELSNGYQLFVPLMIVSTFSFATTRIFYRHSVYTHQLAQRRELMTHDKDHTILAMMEVSKLIETDFYILKPDAVLRDLVEGISKAHRNLFPVVDEQGKLHGMVKMDDVRHLIFKQELYDRIKIKELMYMPKHYISPDDSMEDVAEKFSSSGRFNLAVIDKGKYLGFISRARVFSTYRNRLKRYSANNV